MERFETRFAHDLSGTYAPNAPANPSRPPAPAATAGALTLCSTMHTDIGAHPDQASLLVAESSCAAPTKHPIRVLLVRHGEAEGNVDKRVFGRCPDHAIPLTERGRTMARRAGRAIHEYFAATFGDREAVDHHFRVMTSPFLRTRQTAECLLEGMRDAQLADAAAKRRAAAGADAAAAHDAPKDPPFWIDSVRESPFLAEQDFGSLEGMGESASKYQDVVDRMKLQRDFLGSFWARPPNGESYFQVCTRLVGVVSDIVAASKMLASNRTAPVRTFIIVTHGVTLRAFLSVWCHYSPEWLATSQNPNNCAVRLLTNSQDQGYIFGGWTEGGQLAELPDGVPVASLSVGDDAARTTWAHVLTRIRDRGDPEFDEERDLPHGGDGWGAAYAGVNPILASAKRKGTKTWICTDHTELKTS